MADGPWPTATCDGNRLEFRRPLAYQAENPASLMEIKVECPCGQHYKFDVVPERGRMPVRVNCPSCGADGTDAANAFLAVAREAAAHDGA